MSAVPLYEATNDTVFSSVFDVAPRKVCVLFVSGLAKHKVRVDQKEIVSPQAVCIRRLIFDYIPLLKPTACDWVFRMSDIQENKIVDQVVTSIHSCWQLTRCNNLGIIGVPGSYRRELNDVTAIGKVQVYAEMFDADAFPPHVKDLFFS